LRRLSLPFFLLPGLLPLILPGCSQGYSPNTYASNAAQVEATVQRGTIIGVRQVMISANGAVGAATGGAAGGVAGSQVAGGPVGTALGAIGGTLVGGIGGTVAAQAVANAKGWEYIVDETGDRLVSVTQTSKTALPVGLHVLVISDTQQARIVPDYTVQTTAEAANPAKTAATPDGSTTTEIHVSPLLPEASATDPLQIPPLAVASDPTVPPAPNPASADPTATPPAASAPGVATTPEGINNKSSATGTPSAVSTATPAQAAPGAPSSTPPVSSSSTAMP
jgi:outer membrane lipoprotein SlyB